MSKACALHILVKTREQAEKLKQQLAKGADFGKLAKQHSLCPSGKKGGDLGEFGPGQMVKEFDEVVFSGALNTVHGPVQTQLDYATVATTRSRPLMRRLPSCITRLQRSQNVPGSQPATQL